MFQLVTLKQEQDEGNDGSQSPNYDDDYDEPQDYTMDDNDDDDVGVFCCIHPSL